MASIDRGAGGFPGLQPANKPAESSPRRQVGKSALSPPILTVNSLLFAVGGIAVKAVLSLVFSRSSSSDIFVGGVMPKIALRPAKN